MKVTVKQSVAGVKADLLVFFLRQAAEGEPLSCLHPHLADVLAQAQAGGDFTGKEGQTLVVYPPAGQGEASRLLAVGLGKEAPSQESWRKCGGVVAGVCQKKRVRRVVMVLPAGLVLPASATAQALTEGLILGSYRFDRYKTVTEDEERPLAIEELVLIAEELKTARQGAALGLNGALAACRARDMANEPANHWTPTDFAAYGKELARRHGLKCTVLGKTELAKLKMGGLLGVNQGTSEPPQMVIVEYRTGKRGVPTLMLVGKGLTFDSGGISIKPSANMHEMKYDMCGGAAVLACLEAMAQERPRGLDVVAIVPATDNMPGPGALKPGDIITQHNGKTVEIISTDAEGRLILADALAYGIKKFKPAAVIDLATLTGAVIVGLGHHLTGLMSNDDKLAAQIIRAGQESGEPVWRLPLGKDYRKQIESKVADLKNVGDQGAGTITAGVFLQEFVGEIPWAHLDIAGTAWNFTEKAYVPKGPSGIGVRLLLELIRNWRCNYPA